MKTLYSLNHSHINATFTKNSKDFVVTELPLYDFSEAGEHLVLKIRKKDITTWDMLKHLGDTLGIKQRDFGYAGLKDKDGMTIQYISFLKKYEPLLENFSHDKIKIVERHYHNNKIRMGHLKGNRFFIRLKKVNPTDAKKLKSVIKDIKSQGFPNYFGYQRFGRDKENYKLGKKILEGSYKERNRKLKDFLISSYQSYLFNLWLSRRVEISKLYDGFNTQELSTLFDYPKDIINNIKNQKKFFKLLPGDIMHHYPYGKAFVAQDLESETLRFLNKDITITGPIFGKKMTPSEGLSREVEKDFLTETTPYEHKATGSRRFAWIWAEDIEVKYKEENWHFEINFTLPKGAYATVFLEELLHTDLS
jgi:tRNA pseudouridine13 synthase